MTKSHVYTHIQTPIPIAHKLSQNQTADSTIKLIRERERENQNQYLSFLKIKNKVYDKINWKREKESDGEVTEGEGGNISEQMSASSVVCQVK